MRNNKFNIILLILTILVGIFLFYEYTIDKQKYFNESISSFKQSYQKSINNYKKVVEYVVKSDLNNPALTKLIEEKNEEKISNYINTNFFRNKNSEIRYIDIVDLEGNLIYSLNNNFKGLSQNSVLLESVKTKRESEGLFFSKTIQSYRYVYPIKNDRFEFIGFIDVGVDLNIIANDLNSNFNSKVDFVLDKRKFDEVSKIKYKQSDILKNFYHVNFQLPKYDEKINEKISKSVLLKNGEDFVIDLLDTNIYLNHITFIKLTDELNKEYGYVVKFSNNDTLQRTIFLQIVKFILVVLMIWLLFTLNKKNIESNYFSKQLLDALYKVNIVSKTDLKGRITFVNKNFCEISGYEEEELIGKNHNIVRHEDMPKEYYKRLWDTVTSKKIFNDVIKNKRKDGTAYYVNSTIIPVLDTNDNITEYIAIRNDVGTLINARKQLSEDVKTYDNPCCINVKIDHYEMHSNIYPANFLVKLEKILLDEITSLIPDGLSIDKPYNLLNGEYAFIFDRERLELDEITIFVKKFLQNLNNYKIEIDGYLYEFKFLIAFTTEYEYTLENQKIAIENMANKKIKETILCANGLARQNLEISKKNLETMNMVEDALNSGNVVSHFQPIYNIVDKKIEKYESLVRIVKDDQIISPYFFMDVAKKSSLYKKITIQVLENSFNILKYIKEGITINLSASDIEDIDIRNLLLGYFTQPEYYGRVTFEFLEDETIGDFELIKDFIGLARIMGGVSLAIDDFGSGYSNYERLVEVKPEIVKIDGSLIKDIAQNKSNQNIVKSIVQFAKSENIKTVAEFVADEETYECIKSLEIDYAQGYFIGKPSNLN